MCLVHRTGWLGEALLHHLHRVVLLVHQGRQLEQMVESIFCILLLLFDSFFVLVLRSRVPQADVTIRQLLLDIWSEVTFDAK